MMLTIVLTKTGSHCTYDFNEHTRVLHMALTTSYKSFKRAQFRSKAQKKASWVKVRNQKLAEVKLCSSLNPYTHH